MRFVPTSLTLVGFTVVAGLAGCGSNSPGSTGTGGAGAIAGSSNVPGAGSAGKPAVTAGGSGNGSAGAPVVGSAGNNASGGASNAGAGTSAGGTGNSAGSGPVAGASNNGGTTGAAGGGNTAGSGSDADMNGKTNAKLGDKTSTKLDYLKLGDIRLINNNWGSVAWNCTDKSPSSVFVNADKTFGWSFDRPDCDTGNTNTKPDFPELEFGIHPFGLGSSQATSPNFSSTTLLPKQIKDITSLSVTLDTLAINLSSEGSWDLTFEFWLSKQNPATTQNDAGVYSELMTFWGWQNNRWPIDGTTSSGPQCDIGCTNGLSAGAKSYNLIVQKNSWGSGWKYFQFRGSDGSQKSFNGKVDVKALIQYLIDKGGATSDMWVARLEVGSEIDDQTKGTVTMKNVTFEVNGETRSPVFGQ